jgi:hypothetical protein
MKNYINTKKSCKTLIHYVLKFQIIKEKFDITKLDFYIEFTN